MDILVFYALNIFVGAILAVVLGLYGSHLVARNKTIEIVLLGQGIQVGILLGVIVTKHFFLSHDDHGLHLEILVSLLFTLLLYSLYSSLSQHKSHLKTPLLILGYTLLLSLSYFIVAASPLVESHMVKAFLGDVVTASRLELIIIMLLSCLSLIFFVINRKRFKTQTFELSLFDLLQSSEHKRSHFLFNLTVLGMMIYSIHVLGIVFTLCMMILPITFVQFSRINLKQLYIAITFMAPLAVLLGFALNIRLEQFPTSSLITFSYVLLGFVGLGISKIFQGKS